MPVCRPALTLSVAIALMLASGRAQAALIDFETIPGGTPSEGLVISDQFLATAGVSFALEGGGFPVLAEVGSPTIAFQPSDTPAAGQGTGSFFLTDTGALGGANPPPVIISYAISTAVASGVLLDIDFNESWTIEAFDGSSILLETISIAAGDSGTGNALATPWAFNRPTNDIASIKLTGSRPGAGNVFGLGFDNFDTGIVPEPGTGLLLGSGLVLLSVRGRRPTRRCS